MNIYDVKKYQDDIATALKSIIGVEKIQNKNILITGASGTIASFIVDLLLMYNITRNANLGIYLAGRNIEKLQERFKNIDGKLYYYKYDMYRKLDFEFEGKMHYIIHAAGNSHPKSFIYNPVGTIMGNVDSTKNLLDFAKMHNTEKFLYISSGEVYGQIENVEQYHEEMSGYLDTMSPRSCYPLSKRVVENLCVSYGSQYDIETIIVRPCHTYGPNITPDDSRAHAMFIRNAVSNQDIIMKSYGIIVRSYNYVADCCSAIMTVLLNGNSNEAYNIANPNSVVSIAEFAKTIAKNYNKKVVFEIDNNHTMDTPFSRQVLNVDKLMKLGWKPMFSLEDGICHTVDIIRKITYESNL